MVMKEFSEEIIVAVVERPLPWKADQQPGGTFFTVERKNDEKQISNWKSSANPERRMKRQLSRSKVLASDDCCEVSPMTPQLTSSTKTPSMWYFSSNHIQINKERQKRGLHPLKREAELDEVARKHASNMAEKGVVFHSNPNDLACFLDNRFNRIGENVVKGETIRQIHTEMMKKSKTRRNNIVDPRFAAMGMGTATSKDGELFMCQIFQG
mmetsp:Transcript_10037/g.15427  ORF Transcript_10037/g.15427 Transcript_10037/m.15427 type:complete len:211 (-) Transcript_10037:73-705(-)|eukprot:CAMPEP_0118702460 /NCGR_PEP_ID=MMETSP0800-20121206/17909_1 /TAXON_ID=210618 ORGANISM="Striatella unipunctata, Strain CCMP2910" /NCGR_SAMPLE_ID=MMETSP0800 /ASSEMBLY_ACC=CAM_ASM_000638 /LENGTH=210 /DNA_ID=CAMNT_0006603675 /DNA_START=125 /DNA_END=757 /DNA_ORIENTATION=+